MNSETIRTSVVYVGLGRRTAVYRSIDEVPEEIRRRVLQSTTGAGAVSILIADEKGREELSRALQGDSSCLETRVQRRVAALRNPRALLRSWKLWLELGMVGGAGLLVWLAFTWR